MESKSKKIQNVRHRKIIRDSIQGITKPAIRRICLRAGAKRFSGTIYENFREILKMYMENLLNAIVTFTEHARRKTVSKGDLDAALQMRGCYLGADTNEKLKQTFEMCKARKNRKDRAPKENDDEKEEKEKENGDVKSPHRFKPGTVAARDIKYQQKNSDCFAIPKTNFRRLCREIGQDFSDDLRYSASFFELFQLVVEEHMVTIMDHSNKCAQHADRQTVTPKDMMLARTIMGERL